MPARVDGDPERLVQIARNRGGHVAIVAGPPHVRQVFELLQLEELVDVVDTRGDALASIAH